MIRTVANVIVASLIPVVALAEADGPDFFRVSDLATGEMLDVREEADDGARRIAALPSDTDGLANLGCVGGLSFAEWSAATEDERRAAERSRWCRIGWKGLEGWVPARFLAEGSAPEGGQVLSSWRLVGVSPAEREAELVFLRGGGVSGSTGCNRFKGTIRMEDDRLLVSDPLALTRMACPPEAQALEDRFLAVMHGGPMVRFDPVSDRLTLTVGTSSLVFAR